MSDGYAALAYTLGSDSDKLYGAPAARKALWDIEQEQQVRWNQRRAASLFRQRTKEQREEEDDEEQREEEEDEEQWEEEEDDSLISMETGKALQKVFDALIAWFEKQEEK